ncbi:hypothetical protein [Flagellimonas flava]|uniref:Outer membrane lipoprotein-sorting protein n=1 Tax=Flagellimonas flava TaxID=570519 RepID=A0A1M5Q8S7_9FLAO|nr:hypothetical protein [Allomuricauda flava]SHH10495.1 hypothetical protein SAMN04488116_3558 [Allomuricauda flava]
MKRLVFLAILCSALGYNCKEQPKEAKVAELPEKEMNILEKVAHAHGYAHWKDVKEITFTFNVDRDTTHFERTWVWKPKPNEVTAISGPDTLTYQRKSMDSIAQKTNGGFINDRYWILAPFNLIWDADNFTHEYTLESKAPISGESMQKLTVVYGNEGGYTPGDAYDFYFKDDFVLREWVFRKANQSEPSMTTTWEDYVTLEGLVLAQDHKMAMPGFSLNFSNLSVKK